MANCSNCYNGCTEIVSDRCVKYTGVNIPALDINNGDTLSSVEETLINYLVSTLDGTGIIIDLSSINICTVVQKYLPVCSTCGDITIVDISKALIEAACDIQEQVDAISAELAILNADYTVDCLSGVTSSSDTHAIVQAVITKLCTLEIELDALALDLSTNYVSVEDIDSYIAAYLAGIGTASLISNKMVPYSVLPYYGPLSNFDGTGAGTGDWINIYLCNGSNSTPDLRGRTLVGVTSGMFGGALDSQVNPSNPANPSYTLSGAIPPFTASSTGVNEIVLGATQIPSHTHTITSTPTITDDGHRHKFSDDSTSPTNALRADNDILPVNTTPSTATISASGTGSGQIYETSLEEAGVSVSINSTASYEGGGLGHANVQPSRACYYIIYIP